MVTGIIMSYAVGKNKNGTENVLLLQVRITDNDDIQTVEYMNAPGDDSVPAIGSRVLILQAGKSWKIGIAVQDQIEPEMKEGERKLYSQKNGQVQACIKLLNDGKVIICNTVQSFCALLNEFVDTVDGINTIGSPSNHTLSPTSKTKLSVLKSKINQLFKDA